MSAPAPAPGTEDAPATDAEARIERWMRWKSTKIARAALQAQLAKARRRRSKTTPVPLDLLAELLRLTEIGPEPK